MNLLFCRVGWMSNYAGNIDKDPIKNGGAFNKTNIGHEIYNFKSFNGKYYGYVEAGGTIHIERINKSIKSDYIDDVLVVWIATNPTKGGQYIVGWYKNARIYKEKKYLPNEASLKERITNGFIDYNIESQEAILLSESKRTKKINGIGQNNVWYGNEYINEEVLKYIRDIENETELEIKGIEDNLITGKEKEVLTKLRVNQGHFRQLLLEKFKFKCVLCGVTKNELLIASHIKPWSVSDDNEKLNENNGLLLCANHDKLFDRGLISFSEDGNILISKEIDKSNQIYLNINYGMKIIINEQNASFIKYHRDNIYKK